MTIFIPEEYWQDLNVQLFSIQKFNPKQKTEVLSILLMKTLNSINWSEMEKNVFIVFYRMIESRPTLSAVIAARGNEMQQLLSIVPTDLKEEFKKNARSLSKYSKYFKVISEVASYTPPEDETIEQIDILGPSLSEPLINSPPSNSPKTLSALTPPDPEVLKRRAQRAEREKMRRPVFENAFEAPGTEPIQKSSHPKDLPNLDEFKNQRIQKAN